ncbi:MAG: tetratricopeptide repeat protein, partial [Thermodesulfobacteriota bacterium]
MKSILSALIVIPILLYGCAGIGSTVSGTSHEPAESEEHALPQEKSLNAYYYFSAAQVELKNENLDGAISHMEEAISRDSGSVYLKMELALLYLAKKETAKARDLLRQAIRSAPENPDPLVLYGKVEQEQKKIAGAKEAFEKAIRLDPKQKNVYIILGEIYMDENDLENAARIYGKLTEEFPDYFAAHYFMGKVNLKRGKLKEAEAYFRKSIELEPELDEAKYELIDLFKSQGKGEAVVRMYRDILEKNPESIRSAMELGYYFYETGKKDEAGKIFKELGEKSVSEEEIIRQVFNLYLDRKAYDAALVILNGMQNGAPSHSDIYYLKGLAYDGKGEKGISMEQMRKVEIRSRFYPNATVHIAFLFQEQGRLMDAIAYLEETLPKLPEHADFYLYLGSFYEEAENFSKAEAIL